MLKLRGEKIIFRRKWRLVGKSKHLNGCTGTVKKGELLKIRFDPMLRCKKVIVVSNTDANKETNLVVVCPILHGNKRSPYHISLSNPKNNPTGVNEFVACERLITLDLSKCKHVRVGYVPGDIMYDIVNLVGLLVGDPENM